MILLSSDGSARIKSTSQAHFAKINFSRHFVRHHFQKFVKSWKCRFLHLQSYLDCSGITWLHDLEALIDTPSKGVARGKGGPRQNKIFEGFWSNKPKIRRRPSAGPEINGKGPPLPSPLPGPSRNALDSKGFIFRPLDFLKKFQKFKCPKLFISCPYVSLCVLKYLLYRFIKNISKYGLTFEVHIPPGQL